MRPAPHTLLVLRPDEPPVTAVSPSRSGWSSGWSPSVWLVRRLGLPLWWLAFPPLFHSIWNGNPQTVALALLVVGGSAAAAVAVLIKLYAAVPLLARPRSLLIAGVAVVVTLAVLPWQLYLDDGLGVSSHLVTAWNGSAWRIPILVPPTLLALWILRRDGAEWLAVPAALAGDPVLLRGDGRAGTRPPADPGRGAGPARPAPDAHRGHGDGGHDGPPRRALGVQPSIG